jgi:hypothetical protein
MHASKGVLTIATAFTAMGLMLPLSEAGVISNAAMKSATSRAAVSKQAARTSKKVEAAQGDASKGLTTQPPAAGKSAANSTKPAQVVVSEKRHPETAAHIREAQRLGQPAVLTLDKSGADARRKEALRHVERRADRPIAGKDRDEYPPAIFREGGANADVRYVPLGDNRGQAKASNSNCGASRMAPGCVSMSLTSNPRVNVLSSGFRTGVWRPITPQGMNIISLPFWL